MGAMRRRKAILPLPRKNKKEYTIFGSVFSGFQ
ncbi:hypothetical protein DO76_1585 [Brucella suis]|nr:hypothetical protein DK60_1151 [Brucella canis]AIJ99710.1 hypothetical protein DO76_1585 [Brucella suis]ERT84972.1 hypothetical protein P050_00131 [Brucella abortus 90-12178]KFJ58692.1 hypothetical protein DK64_1864 [Brucella neotomae 5K33]SPU68865.1 Uncharacterised protein [Brucella neotomae]